MKKAAVIPVRWGSTRFPGKPLALIAGISMVERVYRRVLEAGCFDEIIIATDDDRIFSAVTAFGARAVMTSTDIRSGSDRIWAAAKNEPWELLINVQGDEPLISPTLLARITDTLEKGECPVVSAGFFNQNKVDFNDENCVKLVLDNQDQALYFSRSPIPNGSDFNGFIQHIGVYGYSRKALEFFVSRRPGKLEISEKLEQLRFLEYGLKIKILTGEYRSHGVDVPADLARIEKILTGEEHA